MRAALHFFDAKVTSIVKRRLVLRFHKRQLVKHRIAIARTVEQQLRAGVESNQEILVGIVARLNKLASRVACALDFVAAHRTRDVEENNARNGRKLIPGKT